MWSIVWHCTKHRSYDILWGLLSTGWLFYCGWKSASINFNSVFKSSRSCLVGTTAKLEAGSLVLEHCKPTSYKRWDVKGWTSDGASSRGKVKKGAKPFLLRKKEHSSTTSVCCTWQTAWQQDGTLSLHTPTVLPNTAQTPSSQGGQHIRSNREEQDHSFLFHLWSCQTTAPPQLPTDPFRFASHNINV